MITNHTPTPWHLYHFGPDASGYWQIAEPRIEIHQYFDGSGRKDLYPDGYILTPETAEANAKFIVQAVNSHQTLVDALQAIVAVLDGRQPKDAPGALMVAKSSLATLANI